jgi:hypothetical protein
VAIESVTIITIRLPLWSAETTQIAGGSISIVLRSMAGNGNLVEITYLSKLRLPPPISSGLAIVAVIIVRHLLLLVHWAFAINGSRLCAWRRLYPRMPTRVAVNDTRAHRLC